MKTGRQAYFARSNKERELVAFHNRQVSIRTKREAIEAAESAQVTEIPSDRLASIVAKCNPGILRLMLDAETLKKIGL